MEDFERLFYDKGASTGRGMGSFFSSRSLSKEVDKGAEKAATEKPTGRASPGVASKGGSDPDRGELRS